MASNSSPNITSYFNTSPAESALQWFELIFFAIMVPPMAFNYLQHRRIPGGKLAWISLLLFVTMRTVGFALIKAATTTDLYIAGSVISSASTSALFFATAGAFHEAGYRFISIRPQIYGARTQALIHFAVAGSVALIIVGAVKALEAKTSPPAYSQPLEIVGCVLLLLIWVGLCFLCVTLWREAGKTRHEYRLTAAVALVLPFLLYRTVYGIVSASINNSSWNYSRGGPLAAQVCLQVLPDCIIILIYAVTGIITRGIVQERRASDDIRNQKSVQSSYGMQEA